MSKNKKTEKKLVRNYSAPIRTDKTVDKAQQNLKKVHFSDDVLTKQRNPTFTAPEFCTLLQLADEMKKIRSVRNSSRSLPEGSKSRNLNFLPEDRIFQDLVGLDIPEDEIVNEVRSHPCVKFKKDPEIDFEKYKEQNAHSEYFFTSYAVPDLEKHKTKMMGRSIYSKLCIWKSKFN